MQQSINISCLPGAQQQTCTSGFAAVGQTDGQTPYRLMDLAPHTMREVQTECI